MIEFKRKHKNIYMVDTSILVVSIGLIIILISFLTCCLRFCFNLITRNQILYAVDNQGNRVAIERNIDINTEHIKTDYFIQDDFKKPYDDVENDDPEKICTICLEEIGDLECRLKCGHGYHLNCIREWAYVKKNNNCPQCRDTILKIES